MTTRAGEPIIDTCFPLSQEHRRRLLKGDYRALRFKFDVEAEYDGLPPGCEQGATYVLARSRERRSAVDGIAITVPAQPLCWLTITKIGRHKSGDWLVRFDLIERREMDWFLAPGNGYTTSRWKAIDDLAVVPPAHLRNRHGRISDHDEQLRLERVAANRADRWRRKRERKKAVERLKAA